MSVNPKPSTKRIGRSIEDFRKTHAKSYVIPRKIEEALKKLGDGWEYHLEFLRLADVSPNDAVHYAEQFEEYQLVTSNIGGSGGKTKRIWCGTKELAAKLRAMG